MSGPLRTAVRLLTSHRTLVHTAVRESEPCRM